MQSTYNDRAIFFDRDGVINEKRDDHVKNISEFKIFSGVGDAIKLLRDKVGFFLLENLMILISMTISRNV